MQSAQIDGFLIKSQNFTNSDFYISICDWGEVSVEVQVCRAGHKSSSQASSQHVQVID